MRQIPLREATVAADDCAVKYWVAGEGPVLLLANGLLASPAVWESALSHFVDRFRIVWWRYRGLVESEGEPAAPERHARDAALILAAEGIDRVAVIGWSMGVQVALELYRLAPPRVAALALVGGGARLPWGQRLEATFPGTHLPGLLRVLERLPHRLLRQAVALLAFPEALMWATRLGLLGPNADHDLASLVFKDLSRAYPERLLRTAQILEAHDASDLLPAIAVPTLAVAAGRDPITSRAAVERLVTAVPGAEYLVLAAATHFVLLDHADHLHLRLDKFFSEHHYP